MTNAPHDAGGKRVPAEWEHAKAIWLAWPHNPNTWPGHFDSIPERFSAFILAAAQFADVCLIGGPELRQQAQSVIEQHDRVHWVEIPTNDCWIRDYGPTFVVDESGKHSAIEWQFNSWGGKYPPWDLDNAATEKIISHANWPHIDGGLCVEGGALEWDGTGRLLTTTDCLITDTRNPGLTKQQATERFEQLCGAREIVWVDGGALEGDDTDGHIDQLVRFIDASNIVVAVSSDPNDPNREGLEANYEQLCQWGKETSPHVTVHRLPTPPPRYIDDSRVPESYCNFLRVGPHGLLIPTFGHEESDKQAEEILTRIARQSTPDIKVITVNCREMIWGLGALHCASCNEPRG
ncbi:agmatine deiminase family protein [Stieleria sp. JC731]|uniref:agmatine deiminase family protein n=1 Tax=Stieleria sp. JC731 TaxID=2894195 RepID=UPI001E503731|nr:agmatine deiminase family protein [Stieleria sp. JC731]MCC9598976.1 agmatine deiminase family protein [Stieleria sp. JC731]